MTDLATLPRDAPTTRAVSTRAEKVVSQRPAAAQVLLATLPFALVLVGYAVAGVLNNVYAGRYVQGAPNALGFALHIVEPVSIDRWLFGQLPTTWLQDRLHTSAEARWYDAGVAVVYFSHYLVSPVLAALLWFRDRARFRAWVGCVLAMAVLGLATYIAYPMAPPWLAAEVGITEPISRISSLGWEFLHLGPGGTLVHSGQAISNPVAAMPSLHVGYAALCAAFFAVGATRRRQAMLWVYPLTMAFAVVYAGEHYVVDALVAVGYAVAVVAGWRLITGARRQTTASVNPPDRRGTSSPTTG